MALSYLARLRCEAGMSRTLLASAVGVSPATIRNWELSGVPAHQILLVQDAIAEHAATTGVSAADDTALVASLRKLAFLDSALETARMLGGETAGALQGVELLRDSLEAEFVSVSDEVLRDRYANAISRCSAVLDRMVVRPAAKTVTPDASVRPSPASARGKRRGRAAMPVL